jgi:hypothetical protein
MELYIHSPKMPSWRGAQVKHGTCEPLVFKLHAKFKSFRNNGVKKQSPYISTVFTNNVHATGQAYGILL